MTSREKLQLLLEGKCKWYPNNQNINRDVVAVVLPDLFGIQFGLSIRKMDRRKIYNKSKKLL
jgi:hypothetical protein